MVTDLRDGNCAFIFEMDARLRNELHMMHERISSSLRLILPCGEVYNKLTNKEATFVFAEPGTMSAERLPGTVTLEAD